mmetsp:Transcript_22052/g.68212  ORF Transcript_22052/g.68212 Transcript_22052/m.68212 type:complete len:210 (-) Transcript_22052:788-1417(-)
MASGSAGMQSRSSLRPRQAPTPPCERGLPPRRPPPSASRAASRATSSSAASILSRRQRCWASASSCMPTRQAARRGAPRRARRPTRCPCMSLMRSISWAVCTACRRAAARPRLSRLVPVQGRAAIMGCTSSTRPRSSARPTTWAAPRAAPRQTTARPSRSSWGRNFCQQTWSSSSRCSACALSTIWPSTRRSGRPRALPASRPLSTSST